MPFTPPAADSVNFRCGGAVYTPPPPLAANFTLPGDNVSGVGAVVVEFGFCGNGISGGYAQGLVQFNVDFSGAGVGAHGRAGTASVVVEFDPLAAGIVSRYELAGEVRKDGILINRMVRAYRRDTGEFVGEAQCVAGKFRVHTGFAAREHYIVPLDMADDAADWSPPVANRIVSELAQDV